MPEDAFRRFRLQNRPEVQTTPLRSPNPCLLRRFFRPSLPLVALTPFARFRRPSRFFLCPNLSFVAQLLSPDFTIHRSGWSARIPSGEPAPLARAPTCRIGSFRSNPARQAGISSPNPALRADSFCSNPAFRAISPVRTALAVDASLANVECTVQRELAQDIPLDLIRLGQGALPLAVRGDGGSGVFEADRVVDLLRA